MKPHTEAAIESVLAISLLAGACEDIAYDSAGFLP